MLQPRTAIAVKIRLFLALSLLLLLAIFLGVASLRPAAHTSENQATVFPIPRRLPPFHLNQGAFSQQQLQHHWTLLFFGFTHCSDVCPTTLSELHQAYQSLRTAYPELQIVFVSLDPEQEKAFELQRYAATFDKHFIGLSGTTAEVHSLQQQFGVSAEHAETQEKGKRSHTRSIFLINPQGQWLALLPYGLPAKQLQAEFQTIAEKSSHV